MKDLDVHISEPKSFISPHFFEFAKRLFWKGQEITPFPVSTMKESLTNVSTFVSTLLESERKGWFVRSAPSEAIAQAYGIILSYRSKYRSKLEIKAYITNAILRGIRGAIPIGEAVTAVFNKLGYPTLICNDKVGNSIIENIVVDLFSEQPQMKTPSKDEKQEGPGLGLLAEHLVMLLTGLDDERIALGLQTIYAIPILQVHGLVEEMYMGLRSKARQISINGGD